MSGATVPYHLRPHKAVDRRLFVDLLMRFERSQPLKDYVYVSMGAFALVDHKLIHRMIGLSKLVAFDYDTTVVERQKFNRPIDTCHCLQKTSGEVVQSVEAVLKQCSYDTSSGVIVWLDYTTPKELGNQIREFETLLDDLNEGDIVRVTVNADLRWLLGSEHPNDPPTKEEKRRERGFKKLNETIGEFLPAEASSSSLTEDEYPKILALAFAQAALKSFPVSNSKMFQPLSIVTYADGQRMLSITGTIASRRNVKQLIDRLDLSSWPFSSTTWQEVHPLLVPVLTVREHLFLERGIFGNDPKNLISEIGFSHAADIALDKFLENYKSYSRFYPNMLAVEV